MYRNVNFKIKKKTLCHVLVTIMYRVNTEKVDSIKLYKNIY